MTSRITLKQNDLMPVLIATVTDENGVVVDLTNASTVSFSMKNQYTGVVKVTSAATFIVPRSSGQVQYSWISGDTDTVGDYLAEFNIVWLSGNKPQTAPQKTNLYISIISGVV